MKDKFYIIAILFSFIFQGCNNMLDILPDDKPDLDDAFINEYNSEKYLFTCYKYIPSYTNPNSTLGLASGGDILYNEKDRNGDFFSSGISNPMKLFYEGNNTEEPYMDFWNASNGASTNIWAGIRHCNVFLEKILVENGGPKDLREDKRRVWMAEVRTLRAFYHFYLFRLYGPIPIMDKALPISSTEKDLMFYRNTTDEVVDFIVSELDKAIEDLPGREELDASTEYGRFNKTIALCLKAKVLVLAASPLFNNNNYYKGIKDDRGVELFSFGDSKEKWKLAMDACDKACRAAEADGNRILISENAGNNAISGTNVGNIDDITLAMVSLRQAVTEPWNNEVIWALNQSTYTLQKYSSLLTTAELNNAQGANGSNMAPRHAPTLNYVELFYTSNGLPIDEDQDWLTNGWYSNRYSVQSPDSEHSKFYIKPGQKTALLHFHRSPRFYASVGFDGGIWEGRFKSIVKSDYGQFLSGEGCGEKYYGGYGAFSTTGYLAKKLTHLKTTYSESKLIFKPENYSFPLIRLADMYLLLAESLNELGGPDQMDSNGRNAISYLDEIRSRSGIGGVVESYNNHARNEFKNKPASQDGLRKIIHRERINELAFEGSFYYDMRRWLEAEEYFSQPVTGWNYKGTSKKDFYNILILAQPKFTMRDYLMPLKVSTILQNPRLVQNPGWK